MNDNQKNYYFILKEIQNIRRAGGTISGELNIKRNAALNKLDLLESRAVIFHLSQEARKSKRAAKIASALEKARAKNLTLRCPKCGHTFKP